MEVLTYSDLIDALRKVNISSGDKLIVHSSSMAFGRPEKGVETFFSALKDITGPKGVIAAPTFSFQFIEEKKFNYLETTSIGMGALSEFIRKQEGSIRSNHPIQSVTFLGQVSDEILYNRPFSAYEEGGTFDLMARQEYKILLLGVEPKYISHSHLSEERFKVPYRYMQEVSGEAFFSDSKELEQRVWGFYARYLDIEVNPEGEDKIISDLVNQNRWHDTLLNGATIGCGYAEDFVHCLDKKLDSNPYWMIKNHEVVQKYLSSKEG